MIPQDFIDELLARTDIVDIVQSRVTLKKQGQNYQGLCPFHDEKTPSFTVSQDKQFYHCFGCQANGNALKFLMEFDRMDFPAAVEFLAGRAGLEVPREGRSESPEQTHRRKSLYDILRQSDEFYQEQLRRHSSRERAVTYLKKRGLSGAIAREYALGYAPPGWDNLYAALAKTNLERELLIEAGMVVDHPEENKTYDRFRDRIMFPIRDNRGRPIAFGGRIIGDGKPKYLNSPETPVFHKGRELYGLYEARRLNRRLEHLVVVEGYMDVVALAQHGVTCAVATLGTATTSDHLERLFRIVSRLVFCFDGDEAGRNAAWKALRLALGFMKDGRAVRFLFVPDGEDPDSLIRSEGRDKFEARLGESPRLEDVFFDHLQADVDMASIDGKAALASVAMPLIETIPEGVFRQLMVKRLSELTGLDAEELVHLYRREQNDQMVSHIPEDRVPPYDDTPPWEPAALEGAAPSGAARAREGSRTNPLVDRALTMLLRSPELASQFDEEVCKALAQDEDCLLLLEVMRTITERDITSPAVLIAEFQESAAYSRLCRLAETEPLLAIEDFPPEFTAIVRKLVQRLETESIQALRRSLAAKPFAELTASERDMLRSLIRAGSRGG